MASVVACPCHVLGRGDERRSSTDVLRRFVLGRRAAAAFVRAAAGARELLPSGAR